MKRSLLKSNATLLDTALRIFDPVFVLAIGIVSYRIYFDTWELPAHYVAGLLAIGVLALTVFHMLNFYQSHRGVSFAEELRALFFAWLTIAVTGGVFLFVTKTGSEFSRVWSLMWIGGGFILHVACRGTLRLVLRNFRQRGYNLRHVVIAGAGHLGRDVLARVRSAPWSGLAIRAFYDDDPALAGRSVEGIPVAGTIDELPAALDRDGIDQVWIALPLRAEARIRSLLDALRQTPAVIRLVPDIYGFHLFNHSITEVAGMPVLNLTDTPLSGVNSSVKRVEDVLLASFLMVVSAPLWLAIAIGIKVSSRGPILYRQERVTWNGQRFEMLKFRTMPVDAEAGSGPVWSNGQASRATPFGAFLRRFSLDELPQLINVLSGDMSMVGPRPERPEFVAQFRREIPGYMQKHLVKAGITGWAQVNDLRGDSDLTQRIQYDLYYIEHWSVWFDLGIIALTLWHILTSRNAR
jgi:putative colanic acid biosynthesis UDP-glucose lipid carrier transferase